MHSDTLKVAIRRARPSILRDIRRDWESWNLGEKIAIASLGCSLSVFALGRWLGAL